MNLTVDSGLGYLRLEWGHSTFWLRFEKDRALADFAIVGRLPYGDGFFFVPLPERIGALREIALHARMFGVWLPYRVLSAGGGREVLRVKPSFFQDGKVVHPCTIYLGAISVRDKDRSGPEKGIQTGKKNNLEA